MTLPNPMQVYCSYMSENTQTVKTQDEVLPKLFTMTNDLQNEVNSILKNYKYAEKMR